MTDRAKGILNAIVGIILFLFGAFFLWVETRTPPVHSGHIYLFAGIAVLGALVTRPDPIFTVIKEAIVIAKDTDIPFIGGRRSGDPKP